MRGNPVVFASDYARLLEHFALPPVPVVS